MPASTIAASSRVRCGEPGGCSTHGHCSRSASVSRLRAEQRMRPRAPRPPAARPSAAAVEVVAQVALQRPAQHQVDLAAAQAPAWRRWSPPPPTRPPGDGAACSRPAPAPAVRAARPARCRCAGTAPGRRRAASCSRATPKSTSTLARIADQDLAGRAWAPCRAPDARTARAQRVLGLRSSLVAAGWRDAHGFGRTAELRSRRPAPPAAAGVVRRRRSSASSERPEPDAMSKVWVELPQLSIGSASTWLRTLA
jgi:hypothetical protein